MFAGRFPRSKGANRFHLHRIMFTELLRRGLLPSMESVANACDNSMAESFILTLKRELIHRHAWPNRQTARTRFCRVHRGFSTTPDVGTPRSAPQSPSDYEEVRLRGGAVA